MKFSEILKKIANLFKKRKVDRADERKNDYSVRTVDIRFSDIPLSMCLVVKKYGWIAFFRKSAIILKKYPYGKKFTYCKGKTKGFFQKCLRDIRYFSGAALVAHKKEGLVNIAKHFLNYAKRRKEKLRESPIFSEYEIWIQKNEKWTGEEKEIEIGKEIEKMKQKPKISIILPVFDADEIFLRKAVFSVINQYYKNWELCIVNNAPAKIVIKKILSRFKERDLRIKVKFLEKKQFLPEVMNLAGEMATGEFVAFLEQHDELAPNALFEAARIISKNYDFDVLYSDEDSLNENGIRFGQNFKPDWSPELILSQGYVGNFILVRKEILEKISGFREGFPGAEVYDFLLRLSEITDKAIHIPKILYHKRIMPTQKERYSSVESGKKALNEALARRNVKGRARVSEFAIKNNLKNYKIEFFPEDFNEKVTIIIPTKDKVDLLMSCVESVKEKTNYKNYEILVVDNNSKEKKTFDFLNKEKIRYVSIPTKGFNYSRIHNLAVKKVETELILFLNNDTEVISPSWLTAMVGTLLMDKKIGAVGARLIYGDKTIQHGGVVLGPHTTADHANKNMYFKEGGYQNYNLVMRNYSAVTAACMLTRKSLFEKVGGLDENNLAVAFNDVDYCLKLLENGCRIVYNPDALLFHHESKSRGEDHNLDEPRYFTKKWENMIKEDPYYNVNFSLKNVQFELRKN